MLSGADLKVLKEHVDSKAVDPKEVGQEVWNRLCRLKEKGYITFEYTETVEVAGILVPVKPIIRATIKGLDVLKEIENRSQDKANQAAKEDAQEKKAEGLRVKEARRSWWQIILGIFIGWILGGITPTGVWNWILSIF